MLKLLFNYFANMERAWIEYNGCRRFCVIDLSSLELRCSWLVWNISLVVSYFIAFDYLTFLCNWLFVGLCSLLPTPSLRGVHHLLVQNGLGWLDHLGIWIVASLIPLYFVVLYMFLWNLICLPLQLQTSWEWNYWDRLGNYQLLCCSDGGEGKDYCFWNAKFLFGSCFEILYILIFLWWII